VKKISLVMALVLLTMAVSDGRQVKVPIVLGVSEGGVDYKTVTINVTMNDKDSALVAGTKTFGAGSFDSTDYKIALDTYLTVNTPDDWVTVNAKITYPSGLIQRRSWIYEDERAVGVGTYTCTYAVIDTSTAPDSLVSGVDITVTDGTGDFSKFTTRSTGKALISGNNGDTYVITGMLKPGYQFNTPDTMVFPDSNYVDTMKCYNEFSSSKCLVYANLHDMGYDDAENVLVTVKLLSRAVRDTCSGSTILVDYEKQQGYANSSGYIEFYLTPSACIGDKKYQVTFEYNGQVGQTSRFTCPSQTTYDLYNAMN
jgi:hypothetical protein